MLDVTAADPLALAIGVVTLAELRYGASCSERPEENHRAVDDFLTGVTVLPVTNEAARLFGDMKASLRRQGLLIDDIDLLIGATAKAFGLTVVTNNVEHFRRIEDLSVENWVEGTTRDA